MRELPILFSSDMVNAILDDLKTQTRRVIKPQPEEYIIPDILQPNRLYLDGNPNKELKHPYQVGDSLWVRVTWYSTPDKRELLGYVADGDYPHDCSYRKRPSMFMPKSACRIWLEITEIRCQRIQDISAEDCVSEGIPKIHNNLPAGEDELMAFAYLWDSINKKRGYGWDKNNWVWVIRFERIER